jgi:choline dehydrogenase-like flavoprotein
LDEALASTDRTTHADARPFDLIVLGGGSFGSVLASHLFANDVTHAHRILVLEGGPVVLPEHVQNLPPSLSPSEVWGVPWNSDSPRSWNQGFPGLAFCLGGRSLFWGGWSPYFIDSELPAGQWPAGVRRDLTTNVLPPGTPTMSYLDEAARQIGSDTDNDFVFGPLHDALRDRLFAGLKARPGGTGTDLLGQRGTRMSARRPIAALKDELAAPLAVQSASPRPGFFPFNKFNGVQLLIRAARLAQAEAERAASGDAAAIAVKKRLMAVDNAHAIRLERAGRRLTRVVTNQGPVDVPAGGRVFLALGTIESTRLALETLPNASGLIGRNLMAHLRSNLTIRVPRSSFGAALGALGELAVSALFVKGVHTHPDGSLGHFHVQITASGLGALGTDSEAELFKKLPDIDTLERFQGLSDQWIVITLRGIGEMVGDKTSPDPLNRITLDRLGPRDGYDYGQARALVRLEANDPAAQGRNLALWDAMDRACDELAAIFAAGGPVDYLSAPGGVWQSSPPGPDARRDTLSSTHHEGGTLWMGDDPATSVTDEFGRFHEADNLYAVGPALLPTLGSPNPMLSGVALSRRTGDQLVPRVPPRPALENGFRWLFDGSEGTFGQWLAVGDGAFALVDGAIVSQPGGGLGLLYYAREAFGDFTLRLQFRLNQTEDNSGVFVRFRDPRRRVPDRANPAVSYAYANQAWVGVDTGFEIQIDELARPDGADMHRTGAIYAVPVGPGPGQQDYQRGPILQAGQWNDYEVQVVGQTYTVRLGGQRTTTFTNQDAFRGKPTSADPASGYIGLQAHTGLVALRSIRISVP